MLTYFKDTTAFPTIIELLSQDSETIEPLFNDFLTENLKSVLCSTYDENFLLLQEFIGHNKWNYYAREAGLITLTKLAEDNHLSNKELIVYLNSLLQTSEKFSSTITSLIINHHLFEMIDTIQERYPKRTLTLQ